MHPQKTNSSHLKVDGWKTVGNLSANDPIIPKPEFRGNIGKLVEFVTGFPKITQFPLNEGNLGIFLNLNVSGHSFGGATSLTFHQHLG